MNCHRRSQNFEWAHFETLVSLLLKSAVGRSGPYPDTRLHSPNGSSRMQAHSIAPNRSGRRSCNSQVSISSRERLGSRVGGSDATTHCRVIRFRHKQFGKPGLHFIVSSTLRRCMVPKLSSVASDGGNSAVGSVSHVASQPWTDQGHEYVCMFMLPVILGHDAWISLKD